MDIIFAGGKFRAKSKFANIAKISSTRKIGRSCRNNRQPRTCDFVLWTFKNNASTDYILECIYIDIFNMHTQGVPMSTLSIYAKCVGNGWCNVVSLQGLSWFAGRRQKIQKNGVFF